MTLEVRDCGRSQGNCSKQYPNYIFFPTIFVLAPMVEDEAVLARVCIGYILYILDAISTIRHV